MALPVFVGIIVGFLLREASVLAFVLRIRLAQRGLGISVAEQVLDHIERDLSTLADSLGLPYIRPELSDDGKRLLLCSLTGFIKQYVRELHRACRSGANFVYI